MALKWYEGKDRYIYGRHEQLEVLFDRALNDELPKDPEEYWEAVGTVWKLTELPSNQIEAWLNIFSNSPGPTRYTEEWLKNPKKVYRGINKEYANQDCDWAWTTDLKQAKWFSTRFGTIPEVKEFDCSTDTYRVLHVFEDDTESEVILWSPSAYDLAGYYG
jgi:hypothetical protein